MIAPTRGTFFNHVDKILVFFDHLPLYVDIFYLIRVNKKSTFSDYLPIDFLIKSMTYPLSLLNLVKECPPTQQQQPSAVGRTELPQ